MKDLKKFLQILLIGYVLVLGVNLTANWEYYAAGNDWRYSVFFCIIMTSLGCAGGMGMYKLALKLINENNFRFSLMVAILGSAAFGILLAVVVMKCMLLLPHAHDQPTSEYIMTSIWAALFSVLITLIITGQEYIKRLRTSMLENEQMKQEMLSSQFETLKNQVNPHFLFNSLNTLITLIPEQPNVAVDFVQQLSKVFRYSLQYSGENTVDIVTELKITKAYLFLNQQRYGDKLIIEIKIDEAVLQKHIITQSLLMLVENAIKHNEISNLNPLTICIYNDGDYLAIRNTLQKKSILEPSTHIGIENIRSRYERIVNKPVIVDEENNYFTVKLPLLYS